MGQGQSHSGDGSGGGQAAASGVEAKTSYYELLGVERTATDDEIKKAYRRKALQLHPDRNFGNTEASTTLFASVLAAYEVLSDSQERAWYDAHEDAILSGYDPSDPSNNNDPNDDTAYERNVGLTSADDIVRMMGRFGRGNVEFTDGANGFYGFLRDVFERLAREEGVAARREGLESPTYPSFGHKDDSYEDSVRHFYGVWMGFSTRKTFAWRDKYRTSDAPDRRTRRYIEKENQAARNEGIREFNDAVRSLVLFVRKRDPRFKAQQLSEEEREKAMREATAARAARQRAENERRMEVEVEALPAWARQREPDEVEEETGEESEEEQWECVACRKTFKSERQWEAHEKSNKHRKAVQALRKKMTKDGIKLDLEDETGEDDGEVLDEQAYPIMDDPEEVVGHVNGRAAHKGEEDDYLEDVVGNLHIDDHKHTQSDNGEIDDESHDLPSQHTTANPVNSPPSDADDDSDSDSDSNTDSHPKSTTTPAPPSFTPRSPPTSTTTVPPQPKQGKAAQKRAKKAAAAAAASDASENSPSHTCATCNAAFPSKTRLFQHLKDFGHAAPLSSGAGGGGGDGKKGKRGKR